jgi:hypothetical protein
VIQKRNLLIFILCVFGNFANAQNTPNPTAPADTEDNFFIDEAPTPDNTPANPPPAAAKPGATPAPAAPVAPAPTQATDAPRSNMHNSSEGESHPFFDWSKHKGETEVKHPLAEKGLVEITKDRVYIYDVKESKQSRAGSLHIGIFNPQNLTNPDSPSGSFEENYGSTSNMMLFFDYEWQVWRIGIGKIGITAGAGLFFAQGSGHYVHPELEPTGQTPPETFSLAVFPLSGGLIYRLQIWDKQLIVPYGSGGLTLFPFGEFRDDGLSPKFAGSAAVYAAVGGALNLTYFDHFAALALDRQYGINRVYLFGEFRELVNIAKYDFGGPLINFGFTAEF